ncbi:MAG: glycoside hydrolase family 2, partial [Bacteroidetes bacterium]
MDRLTGLFLTLTLLCIAGCQSPAPAGQDHIQTEFERVPEAVKPWAYWYWMDDNVSKQGITDDLESMAEIGIKEVFIGNIGGEDIPSGDVRMLSEEWWELMRWSIREGHRTGVDIGVFNSPGWSQSGGPWVTPDKAMRFLVSSETEVTGPARFNGLLPAPTDPFQDVAVLALPVSSAEVYLSEKEHKVWTKPAIQDPQRLTDGNLETSGLFPDLGTSKGSITIEIETAEPFTARSLVLHPAEHQILADCELYAEIEEEFKLVRTFELDRHNEYLPVGPVPYAELAISLPAVTSQRFRLVISLKESNYFIAPAGYVESVAGGLKEIELCSGVRLEYYMEKQLAKLHQDPVYSGTEYIWESQAEPDNADLIVGESEVINLTDRLSVDGGLEWEVPEGRWVIQRIGMTPTGVENHPALPHARGLEIDKMNPEAIQYHFDQYVGKLQEGVSEAEQSALKHVIIDSYEVGSQNWTDQLEKRFQEVYGYDPVPWLPVLSGRVVGSVSQSDRFLWDLRRLVADDIAKNYVGGLKEAAHR